MAVKQQPTYCTFVVWMWLGLGKNITWLGLIKTRKMKRLVRFRWEKYLVRFNPKKYLVKFNWKKYLFMREYTLRFRKTYVLQTYHLGNLCQEYYVKQSKLNKLSQWTQIAVTWLTVLSLFKLLTNPVLLPARSCPSFYYFSSLPSPQLLATRRSLPNTKHNVKAAARFIWSFFSGEPGSFAL